MLVYGSFSHMCYGTSPSFVRSEIIDKFNDWYFYDITHQGAEKYHYPESNITTFTGNSPLGNIGSVSYFSNGRTLNATIGLVLRDGQPGYFPRTFQDRPNHHYPVYGMSVDVDANPKTGYLGSDYAVEIQWNGTEWIKRVMENSALGHIRLLDVKTNYTDFFDKQHGIVLLSLDLSTINYPKQYLLDFYIKDYLQSKDKQNMKLISDYTNWINIPPPEYVISTSPNSVMLREDETKAVEVSITPIGAATRVEPSISINVPSKYPDLDLKLNPNQTTIQSNSTATSLLKITAVKNAAVHPYTLHIQTQIFFPSQYLGNPIESMSKNSSFTVTVLEPYTYSERFTAIWNTYGDVIKFIIGAFAVGGSTTGIASAAVYILRKQGIMIKKANSDSSGSTDHRT